MTISELNNILTTLAKSSYLVKETFTGDVYDIDSKENKFACFVATPMTGVKNDGTITYNYTLYYVDRLTQSEDNIDFVQSDAVRVLKGIINFLEEHSIEVDDEYQITLFRHQFDDWCAGAYVEVNFTIPDGDCDDEFNLSGELRHLDIVRNGVYEPTGFDGYNRITVSVPSTGATEEWVDEEIDRKLEDYASLEWVQAQGYLTQHQDISGKADKSYVDTEIQKVKNEFPNLNEYGKKTWVNSQGFLKTNDLDGYATETYVNSQGFLKDDDLNGYATETYVNSQGFVKEDDIEDLASKSWVRLQNYLIADDLDGLATENWVRLQGFLLPSDLDDFATEDWVRRQEYLVLSDLCGYATQNWVQAQGYLIVDDLCGFATEDWVKAQGYLIADDLDGLATETWVKNWVQAQGYLLPNDLDGYATELWVLRQDFATKEWVEENAVTIDVLNDYATKEWVEAQGYLTEESDPIFTASPAYTITSADISSWDGKQDAISDLSTIRSGAALGATSLQQSKVWTGNRDEWDDLTDAQKASYTIALITE